jgi:hypothetical protein
MAAGAVQAPNLAYQSALMGGPGGGGAAAGPSSQAVADTTNMVRGIASNMGKLGGGALESMSEDEQKFLFGTAGSLGFSAPGMLDAYQRSRIGQQGARLA